MQYILGIFLIVGGLVKIIEWKYFAGIAKNYDIFGSERIAYSYPIIQIVLGASFFVMTHIGLLTLITILFLVLNAIGIVRAFIHQGHFRVFAGGILTSSSVIPVILGEYVIMTALGLVVLFTF
jgi:uncharacterized membrane protein HdeD (DUF308 family)